MCIITSNFFMVGRAAILALLPVVGVLGYSDTVPIVAWSSKSSSVLNGLSPDLRYEDSVSIIDGVLSPEGACSFDTVLVINQPGLRSSDLRALPTSSGLSAILNTAPSSRQYPHVKRSASASLQDITESLARRCGSTLTNASPADGPLDLAENSKHVVCVNMPAIEGSPKLRKVAMLGHDQYLFSEIEKIDAAFTSHLVLYVGSPLEHPGYRRQLLPPSEFDSTYAPDNSTLSDGGIFKRYQLFSTPLLVALLVVFFIIVPIIMMAVSALASLQSSVRLEAPKGYHAQEKKTQ
ncbi:uncharacterized protein F5891DRAFT_1021195 [Suillus fuscotomentosus]|uniref:Protein BIG1 n=1 Tax=Suillus fuscotomentosus TaxID=1912939 RepID=A0AAD4EAQ3_9AGAM|nr:uncharacterized protein F5891DRAFT_1021195 [Suillus fuscotomentosus]KAG1902784.1 hypothetical protein F5891DRAFT_1021195 [Suillus fuscotomentosus]